MVVAIGCASPPEGSFKHGERLVTSMQTEAQFTQVKVPTQALSEVDCSCQFELNST